MHDLAAGCHLFPDADGSWLCAAPNDRFVRVGGPGEVIALASRRHARSGTESARGHRRSQVGRLMAALAAHGLATEPTTRRPARSARAATVLIEGGTPVAAAVAHQLSPFATLAREAVDEDAVASADVLVSCVGWLPDSRWRALQEWCRRHGTAWHRCHAEGDRFFVGPIWTPSTPHAVGYDDVRGRRLAASPVADHLVALWAHLEDPADVAAPVRWPGRPGISLIAALVAADVEAYLSQTPVLGTPAQVEVDLQARSIVRHPVLPLPDLTGSRNG